MSNNYCHTDIQRLRCIHGLVTYCRECDDFIKLQRLSNQFLSIKSENKMKPFNLEKALAGDPVICRNGKKVDELHYFKSADIKDDCQCIVTVIDTVIRAARKTGLRNSFGKGEDDEDLFMAPTTKKYYVNVYKYDDGHIYLGVLKDDKPCPKSKSNYIKTIEFEIEENN